MIDNNTPNATIENTVEQQRILIFSNAYLPLIGGAELAVKEITDRLQNEFFLITTRFSPQHPKKERIGNVTVYRVGTGRLGYIDKLISPFVGAVLARRLVKEERISLYWCIMLTFMSGAPYLLKITGLSRGVPILQTVQEGDDMRHLTFRHLGIIYLSWRAALYFADHIQVISTFLKELAQKRGARAPIDVVPNGVNFEKFHQAPRSELHFPVTIITTSRLVKKNGVDTLIKAMSYLPFTDHRLRVVGDGPERARLVQLAEWLGIKNCVDFQGPVPFEEIPEELKKADIFARISRSEGLGISFLEAMAAGLPIIATNVGGIPDFLKDGETGLFASVDDPQDVAEKIKLLIEDNNLRGHIAKQGQELVKREYSWDTIAERMNIIFQHVIVRNS